MNAGKTLCFTGHREQKIPWCADPKNKICIDFKIKLGIVLDALIAEGYENFISGMATGADTLCASLVLAMKRSKYKNIKLLCYLPFKDHYAVWNNRQIKTYDEILKKADSVVIVSDHCVGKSTFYARNHKMVDDSEYVIGIYNNSGSGGTFGTLNYAAKNNKKILVMNTETLFISKFLPV